MNAADRTGAFPPSDERMNVRHGNHTFAVPSYDTLADWEARAADLRRRVLVSAGLWPLPDRCPLSPRVTGRIDHPEYTIENLYFESWPGFYVTGNLYRPRGKPAPYPGVASPHGHWGHGRFEHGEQGSVLARCIQLARMGCVVFAYDMIGYNDSGVQVRRKAGKGGHVSFFASPDNYLWGISVMGLQLWNSIRVIDLLCSLPDVDGQRIGCTGASGGGSQTFALTAVDDRVKVSAPVNMISAHFQGGCLCENIPNLRLDCTNVEIGATMAPRPMLMVSASGDWTVNTPQVEYPAVRSVYRLYGAEDKVATVQVDAPHNYNRQSREAVYSWFGRWLCGTGDKEPISEGVIDVDPPEAMLVFPDGELPAGAVTPEELVQQRIAGGKAQVESLRPRDAATLHAYRELMGTAYRYAVNAAQPQAVDLYVETAQGEERAGVRVERLIIGRKTVGERMPGVLLVPERVVGGALVVYPQGKSGLVEGEGFAPLVARLLERGLMVLSVDAFETGELTVLERNQDVPHFSTFNRTTAALRVQDVLNALAHLQTRTHAVHLVGVEEAGLWCLLARGLAAGVATTVVDADQFQCEDDEAWLERLYIPQLRRAGDLRTAAALSAPGPLFIHNAAPGFPGDWFEDVYRAAGAADALHIQSEAASVEAVAEAL